METSPLPPPLSSPAGPARPSRPNFAVALKLLAIGVLVLLLQAPLWQIRGTLDERRARRDEAVRSIAQSWGGDQTILGPVLVVPYPAREQVTQMVTTPDGRTVPTVKTVARTAHAWFLPEELAVEGALDPAERRRGIFTAVVYGANLIFSGTFRPDAGPLDLGDAALDWSRARVLFWLMDPRGLRAPPRLEWDGQPRPFGAGPGGAEWGSALVAETVPVEAGQQRRFRIELALQGHHRLGVVPVGDRTRIALAAPWPDPGFTGYWLPAERTVGESGFAARWETTHLGRGFPSRWADGPGRTAPVFSFMVERTCGFTFVQPIDAYRLVERATKYALLFLTLVFAVFFLFEVTAGVRVHPVQYLLVGVGLVLFYLGFLSLAEFIGAGLAYAFAAAACTLLITAYASSMLHAGRRSLVVGGGLAATYGYLYFVLQLQDYALLAGTAALFAILAVAMWATRRLDWYAIGGATPPLKGN